jgi:hypothetical protein
MKKRTLLIVAVFAVLVFLVFGLFFLGLIPFRAKLLFPDAGFDMKPVVKDIMTSFQLRDIATIESMLCPGIKKNVKDLPEKIEELLGSIQGNITEITWNGATASSYQRDGKRKRMGRLSPVPFTTTTGLKYSLGIGVTYRDDSDPDAIGVDTLRLLLVDYEDQLNNIAVYEISYHNVKDKIVAGVPEPIHADIPPSLTEQEGSLPE